MKTNIILLLALLYITLQQTTLLASNTNNVISTSLPFSNIIIESFHNTNNSGVIGYGAKWIWIPGSSWPDGFKADFQAQFYANCQSPVILYITADNIFSASINSGPAVTGSDWTKPFAFKISNINCGINTININVTNRDIGSHAGLIFAIVQDQSSCFSCQSPLSFYNQNTCQCECISTCTNCSGLNSNYVWNNYPTCGCKCPPQVGRCSLGTYFNQKTCKCECSPIACWKGYRQDPNTCNCVKNCENTVLCIPPAVFNSSTCACTRPGVCLQIQLCKFGYIWDVVQCSCVPFKI